MHIVEHISKKSEGMTCGTACINYICKCENLSPQDTEYRNIFWIMDLGSCLIKKGSFSVCLFFKDSRLMNDYGENRIPNGEYVKKAIDSFLDLGGTMTEKEFAIDDVIEYKRKSKWVILNLRSDILFNDLSLKGNNHFVILESCEPEISVIISPGRTDIFRISLETDVLMHAMRGNGQWILFTQEWR